MQINAKMSQLSISLRLINEWGFNVDSLVVRTTEFYFNFFLNKFLGVIETG